MPQSRLGINRNVPKDFSGLFTPLEVGRWPLLLPQIQVQQMERVQQVLQNETCWVLIHRDLALQSRIIPAPGCSVPISTCSCSMTPLPSALTDTEQSAHPCHPSARSPASLGVCQSDISPCVSLLTSCCWQSPPEPGEPMPGTCWAGSGSCAVAGRGTWAASSTLAESTALPQPGAQQDLGTRNVKGWQEKMLLFSWPRPSPHPYEMASADFCISSFSRS